MKKLTITLAIILGLGLGSSFAQGSRYYASEEVYCEGEGGLFGKGLKLFGGTRDGIEDLPDIDLPNQHGLGTDQGAPLGSGIAVLVGLGAAYLVGKKRKED